MARADYFDRAALAASQVISGFDPQLFSDMLVANPIELCLGPTTSVEARALTDLTVRLLARLYPTIAFRGPEVEVRAAQELARRINPRLDLETDDPQASVVIGRQAVAPRGPAIFAGSDGWSALLSDDEAQEVGHAANPIGAGAAACIAAARLFRRIFFGHIAPEARVSISVLELVGGPGRTLAGLPTQLPRGVFLVGAGAIGNAVLWTLDQMALTGQLHVMDDEAIDLTNLQRYVLAERGHVGAPKVVRAAEHAGHLTVIQHPQRWQDYVASNGCDWDRVLVAVDSIQERRDLQSSLPRWIANAWTQPDDLALSTHRFDDGPCLGCVYLPEDQLPSDDEILARDLHIDYERFKFLLRDLLYRDAPPPTELLTAIADGLKIDPAQLAPYRDRSLRILHVEGVCGGGLVSMQDLSGLNRDVHVPLAHQSALAGVLLAAALICDLLGSAGDPTRLVRLNLNRALSDQVMVRPQVRDGSGRCICRDPDFLRVYHAKWDGVPFELDVALRP